MSATVQHTREVALRGAIWFWLVTLLMGWVIVGCVVAGIWWVVW